MFGAAILQGSPQPSGASALYRLHVFVPMSHFGNMINSSSSNHSLWHRIDYWNSGRGRWRGKKTARMMRGRVGKWIERRRGGRRQEHWEGVADISARAIREAWDEEDKVCAHTYKQFYLTLLYSPNRYSSFPLQTNQTSVHSLGKPGARPCQGPMRTSPHWHLPSPQQHKCDL